jgi:hypothetical protein
MADGRRRLEWDQTSGVLAMLFNANRTKGASPAHPADFHPMRRRQRRKPKVSIRALKTVFVR